MRTILITSLITLMLVFTYLVYAPEPEDKPDTEVAKPVEPDKPAVTTPEHIPVPLPRVPVSSSGNSGDLFTGDDVSIDVGQIDDFDQAVEKLDAIGMDAISTHTRKWREQRGYAPQDGQGNLLLEKPHNNLDDDELRLQAENGDMWAQQIYADRIAPDRPADALDMYRMAAQNGSLHAMKQVEKLYAKLAGAHAEPLVAGDTYTQQRADLLAGPDTPEQAGTAWAIVAQMAGADPSKNAALKSRLEQNFSADGQARVCLLAETIYSNLLQARTNNNLGNFDRSAPPLMSGSVYELSRLPCSDIYPGLPDKGPDFSACNEIKLIENRETQLFTACNQ
jgi:hypothetical protein